MNDLIARIDYEVDSWDSCGKSELLSDCRAEIQRLTTNNEALTGLCQDYAAEIKALEAKREYVPMTDDELVQELYKAPDYSDAGGDWGYERHFELTGIKRAGLRIKERDNG